MLMFRTFMIIFAGLFTCAVCGLAGEEEIDNWDKLTQAQQTKASALVSSIYSKGADILDEFKIIPNMTYYSTNLKLKYKGEYPNNKAATVIVGHVPLQFVEHYEAELQKFYEEKDDLNVIPRLDVVLAIHYTESNYIPSVVAGTDDNPAYGMMQLTISTAKDLYRRNRNKYEAYFSIEDDKVVFGSTQDQIALTIRFLTEIKKYSREYETGAIRRYIGSGDEAKSYAALVLNRARLYKKMRNSGQDIDRKEFIAEYSKEEVKTVINNQLETKGFEPLTDGEYKEAIDKALLVYEYDGTPSDDLTLPAIDNGEIKKLPPKHFKFPPVPSDGCEYYLKIEEGRTLYSYFGGMKNMVATICDQKNEKFSVFYNTKSGKKVLKSLYDIDPKNDNMQTSVKAGDVIYLPPDMVIKGDKETAMNLLRTCPEEQKTSE
jgi:hypothetical protein